MNPGRELDQKVADIIGWYEINNVPRQCKEHESGESCGLCWGWDDFPAYSTDNNAAMEVWDWLEAHPPFDIGLCLMRYNDKPAVMAIRGPEIDTPLAVGETYPHAICLAVLAV